MVSEENTKRTKGHKGAQRESRIVGTHHTRCQSYVCHHTPNPPSIRDSRASLVPCESLRFPFTFVSHCASQPSLESPVEYNPAWRPVTVGEGVEKA